LDNQIIFENIKYIAAKNQVYSVDEQQDTDFLFNVETITAYENCQKLAEVSKAKNGVQGMVFGKSRFFWISWLGSRQYKYRQSDGLCDGYR